MPIRSCRQCGKRTSNKHFCSRDCYNNSQRTRGKMVECHGCKKEFYLRPYQFDNRYYYCSKSCREDNPPKSRLTCKQCGEYYFVSSSLVRSRSFCSIKCSSESKKKHRESICPVCNNTFSQPSGRNKTYCSKKCVGISRRHYTQCCVCDKQFWDKNKKKTYCSDKCKKESKEKQKRTCKWCGDKCESKNSVYCCRTCAKMYDYYGHINLKTISVPDLTVYINNGEKSLWLPLSASEIDITLYLYHQGCSGIQIRKHIKRWREARKKKEEADKNVRQST